MSSPVRKAREESVRLVSRDLEKQHLGYCDENGGVPAFPFQIPDEQTPASAAEVTIANLPRARTKLKEGADDNRPLTLADWKALVAFWDHGLFIRTRRLGMMLGFLSIILITVSLSSNHWTYYEGNKYK